jgi:hypothetical protein
VWGVGVRSATQNIFPVPGRNMSAAASATASAAAGTAEPDLAHADDKTKLIAIAEALIGAGDQLKEIAWAIVAVARKGEKPEEEKKTQ